MVRFISMLARPEFLLVAVTLTGCARGGKPPELAPAANSLRAEDLVGKWRLVRAGGEPPAEMWIYSREIDIAADGVWKAKQRGSGPLRGMNQDCGGTWSLADGVVTCTNGAAEPFKSQVKVESGRLIVEPDFSMGIAKKGPPVTGEYERPSPPGPRDREEMIAAMKFVKAPRGTFWMGWDSAEKQSRQVEIKQGFELAAYPVTQGQWQELMGNNPSEFSRNGRNSGMVPWDDDDLLRFPVESVSWNDAQEFLKKLNEREKGKGWLYRLPSEAEWEYACRGTATSREECSFDFYLDRPTNELSPKFANFNSGKNDVTVKVGSYPPNKLGLYDMHGKLSQWCDDRADPKGTARVVRGGNWAWTGKGCWAAARNEFEPSSRLNYCGFRVARVAYGGK